MKKTVSGINAGDRFSITLFNFCRCLEPIQKIVHVVETGCLALSQESGCL